MPTAFADICFTPSVKAAQSLYGSRQANRGFELSEDARNSLGEREAEFIAERDSFYQATVSESGWPYVQHRGGPKGFLKVLDDRTLGFADFRGNIQYLSVGNLNANDRISLILMDYPNRRRLKIWGRVRIVHESDEPDLIEKLEVATYRARVERGIVIYVEAYDWNCPQHITPRYTEAEIEGLLGPLREENRLLKAQASATPNTDLILGDGPLELAITGIRQLTKRVRAFELSSTNGAELPGFEAGAHLTVPVRLSNGELTTRHYSICSDPANKRVYEIAVLREASGQGGSVAVHELFALGLRLNCSLPKNNFVLHTDSRPAILIAGGIGITPIKAMTHSLQAQAREFQIHYAVRSETEAAYLDPLKQAFGDRLTVYAADQHHRLNPEELLSASPADAVFYLCGPNRLIEAVTAAAQLQNKDLRLERFSVLTAATDQPVIVELKRSKRLIQVEAGQSILAAVCAAGVDALHDCRVGNCGSCAVKVLDGVPDHRDSVLSQAEKDRARLMCICVSRARSERLVLDL
ncbi:Flavodoxin reductases (ferredoxin-NADPH reductases) family 1 [Methylomonas albis]|uniref:Pyridoxamine 5'-phosphate oxidase family protein n=1 Tax=Methylomonas albis TaxID=1854563 RepID=A0ABR9CYN2_9GAMM|nr:pyridoxamine 5'-phosphate oxidase family protein [Methylomonas albis]MBD9355979.1 pyridoxamine 5'-phosphate oxidase family protein [Methylomonas albis]CAD6879018.1 Flavodoxin reductases (ferredoxin-NADPH reductases) family 1 [Methylomonas albis]